MVSSCRNRELISPSISFQPKSALSIPRVRFSTSSRRPTRLFNICSTTKPAILARLPTEVLNTITTFALTRKHSHLEFTKFKPLASSLNMQLACKALRDSVNKVLFRRTVLNIEIWSPNLYYLLHANRPDQRADLLDISAVIAAHAAFRARRLANLALFPLHRFRCINIQLTPQLSHLNLPKDLEGRFFPEVHEYYPPFGLDRGFDAILEAHTDSILKDAEGVAGILRRQLASTKGMVYGHVSEINLWVNETGTLPSLERVRQERPLRDYRESTLPGQWAMSSPVSSLLSAARMPCWHVDDMRRLMLAFGFLRGDRKCLIKSLFETVQLPNLRSFSFDEKSANEQHELVRTYLIGLWKGSWKGQWGEWKFTNECPTLSEEEPRSFFLGDLRRRISPRSSSAVDNPRCTETRCSFCDSKHRTSLPPSEQESSKFQDRNDAFEILSTDDEEFRNLYRRIDVLLQRFLAPWRAPFKIDQEVLFQKLVDLQVDFLLSASRKDGTDVNGLRRKVDEWVAVKDECARIVRIARNKIPEDHFASVWEVVVRKKISKLPGGYETSRRVRAAADGEDSYANSGSAWSMQILRSLEKLAAAPYHVPIHPAIIAKIAREAGGIREIQRLCQDMGLV